MAKLPENFVFQIYDDVLTEHQVTAIAKELLHDQFPWFFYQSTVDNKVVGVRADSNTREFSQFVHAFNTNNGTATSQHVKITDYILKKFIEHTELKIKIRFRVKANLQLQVQDFKDFEYNTPHYDIPTPHMVLIYYPIDSDGNTRIFTKTLDNEEEYNVIASVEPKAGRFLLFNGRHYHAGANPVQHEKRLVINFNFVLEQ